MRKNTIKAHPQPKTLQVQHESTQITTKMSKQILSQQCSEGQGYRFTRKSNRYENLRKQHRNYKEMRMGQLLVDMVERRKRYCFQMVKLMYLFPDDTFSENVSVNSYDRLFYQDQHIHTIVKIYQTKEMEAKIWAFLNLKALHKRKMLQKFITKFEKLQQKQIIRVKKNTFDLLLQYSIKIQPQRTMTIERLEPINTRIEKSVVKVDQTSKTERIQRNVVNNFKTVQSNQIIRLDEAYSPVVKRIHLTPDDVKIIYPSTIKNSGYRQYTEANKIYSFQPAQINQSHIHAKEPSNLRSSISVKKIDENPNPSIYINETIKRIEPVRIKTEPAQYEIKENNHIYPHAKQGYGYLVHTVQGNCTINIYNGDKSNSEKRQTEIQVQTKKQIHQSSFENKLKNCETSFKCSHCHNCHTSCCAFTHHCSCIHHCNSIQCFHVQSQPYCLEDRIEYLRKLELMVGRDEIKKKGSKL